MRKLDPDDPRSPYLQVADIYRQAIASGELRPGDKLPAHQAVIDDLGVSLGVVKRAYAVLQREGLIVTRQGQGAFVRTQLADAASADVGADLAAIRATLADLVRRVGALEDTLSQSRS